MNNWWKSSSIWTNKWIGNEMINHLISRTKPSVHDGITWPESLIAGILKRMARTYYIHYNCGKINIRGQKDSVGCCSMEMRRSGKHKGKDDGSNQVETSQVQLLGRTSLFTPFWFNVIRSGKRGVGLIKLMLLWHEEVVSRAFCILCTACGKLLLASICTVDQKVRFFFHSFFFFFFKFPACVVPNECFVLFTVEIGTQSNQYTWSEVFTDAFKWELKSRLRLKAKLSQNLQSQQQVMQIRAPQNERKATQLARAGQMPTFQFRLAMFFFVFFLSNVHVWEPHTGKVSL